MKNQTLKKFTGKEVDEAMRWVHDLMMWCQIPCFLLGETLRQVKEGENLSVEKIEIGVRKQHLTQDTSRLLKTFVPDVVIGDTINLTSAGVPIEIKVIKRHYAFFDFPDFAYYNYDEYKVPNPWTGYMKARYLVR